MYFKSVPAKLKFNGKRSEAKLSFKVDQPALRNTLLT